jgi:hypothetical protein
LPQAAITLTNHLLESLLKFALIYDHARKNQPTEPPPKASTQALRDWLRPAKKLYMNQNLRFAIDSACSIGLITEAQRKQLHEFRQNFRNAFSHADKDKTFRDVAIQVTAAHVEGETIATEQPEEVPIADLLVAQGLFQVTYARKNAMPYFLYIDQLAGEIRAKVFLEEEQGPMTIEAALESSAALSKWLDDSIHDLHIPSGDRESMTGSLFDQVHETIKRSSYFLKTRLSDRHSLSFAQPLKTMYGEYGFCDAHQPKKSKNLPKTGLQNPLEF